MQIRFHDLLRRYATIRRLTDAERGKRAPNPFKLLRLHRMRHTIERQIKVYIAERALRRASRPHFMPTFTPRENFHTQAA